MSICFIAEIGVNHNGSLDEALWLIDQAAGAGADVAKFQLWEPKSKPGLADLALDHKQLEVCADYCHTRDIEFMCTPFDVSSLWWLVDKLNVQRVKLASSAIFDHKLLEEVARTYLPVILSTGMADMDEIICAARALRRSPSVTLLHCVSGYPVPPEQANLRAIQTLQSIQTLQRQLEVGYSDHTGDRQAIFAAAAIGAKTIELHITRNCSQDGPDHSSSHEAVFLKILINTARRIVPMLGDGEVRPQPCAMALRKRFA